jgi:hypothetical protein
LLARKWRIALLIICIGGAVLICRRGLVNAPFNCKCLGLRRVDV